MDNITLKTASISDTTYNVAADSTAAIDPIGGDSVYGVTEFTSTDTVGELPNTQHPVYKSGKVLNNFVDFLSRPYVVKTGTITPSVYGLLAGSTTAITANGFNVSDINQVSGSVGLRFTLCFKLEISATPQAAGIFKIGVLPFSSGFTGNPLNLPTAYATMPSAEINLADTSSVILKYPFNWTGDYLPLTSTLPYCSVGVVAYTPFSPGVSAGLSSTYTIYQWFEDVEAIGPGTPFNTPVVPQMGMQEFSVAGPVSKVMSYANKITGAVGSAIPMLTSYTRPLGWVFSGIGTLASHFGWSKPNNSCAALMGPTVCSGINTVTGVGTANELGMYANNEVNAEPYFCSKNFDEMALCYLTCIPCPIATVLLNGATDAYGMNKWSTVVSPSFSWYQGRGNYVQRNMLGTTGLAVLPSTFMATSAFFGGWRGDLIYRFKFARSKFMGGKILIGYNPFPDTTPGSIPLATRRYDFASMLVDLRTTTVADLRVPFSYPLDFCPTNFESSVSGVYTTNNTGCVFMTVIEPLVSAGETAPQCYVQVEVFSECGITFANALTCPIALAPVSAPIEAQMGGPEDLSVLKRTCGEAILSVKQLCMRPSFCEATVATSAVPDSYWSSPNLATSLLVPPAYDWRAPPGNLALISSWYRFFRGSILWHALPLNSETTSVWRWGQSAVLDGGNPISFEDRIANSVRRPFYNYHARGILRGYNNTTPQDIRVIKHEFGPAAVWRGSIAVTAGDDFQLGCFVSIPPMVSVTLQDVAPFF